MPSWNIKTGVHVAELPGVHPVVLQLLANRGIVERDAIQAFLNPQYEHSHDPFLFRDMEKFVSRIREAVKAGETVYVYGDYDADGVCSSVQIVETLKRLGVKHAEAYIPHREKEGYGLNAAAIDYIAGEGATLIITVDCGTGNVHEVAHARAKGIDVVILDHHEEPAELPRDTAAFLNPHLSGETYPFKNLAAAGVAFKAVQALWKSFNLPEGQEKWFLDLVAIATVTDMMPLVGENRALVTYGLKVLNKTRRSGLLALIAAAKKTPGELGVYEIGFMLGPRLNAAGRLDHASTAYELLETQDARTARDLAELLNATNSERQSETERLLAEALLQVKPQLSERKVLVAVGDNWPVGVVGLVSGRITELYHRPSLVISRSGEKLVGSGRSIPGFNITEALAEGAEHLAKFGGHEGACGFTLHSEEALAPFGATMNAVAERILSDEDLVKTLTLDAELSFDAVDFTLAAELERLAPFGMGNPRPKFSSFGARIKNLFLVGSDGAHMKLMLEQNGVTHEAIGFRMGAEWHGVLNPGDMIDVAYEVEVNTWNGKKSVQLKLIDIKKP
ncbi:MAG: single-stranded-DNA-specific exonuclease RecJ [Parcubacteria group bacterium]|nr:single-stranded-DNA-specific exonuclease RecJ [Parcubacteria group bacterium]